MAKRDTEPTKEQLEGDLVILRRLLDQQGEPFYKVRALRDTAQRLCPSERDAESIEMVLKLATSLLGANRSAEAMAALYGLTEDTKGMPLPQRQQRAWELSGVDSFESFRTRYVGECTENLADVLFQMPASDESADTSSPRESELGAAPATAVAASDSDWYQLRVDLTEPEDVPEPVPGCFMLVGADHSMAQLAAAIYLDFARFHLRPAPSFDSSTGKDNLIECVINAAKRPPDEERDLPTNRRPRFVAFFKSTLDLRNYSYDCTSSSVSSEIERYGGNFFLHFFGGNLDLIRHLHCTVADRASSLTPVVGAYPADPVLLERWP